MVLVVGVLLCSPLLFCFCWYQFMSEVINDCTETTSDIYPEYMREVTSDVYPDDIFLDGLRVHVVHEQAIATVEQAQASSFRVKVNSFVKPRISRNRSRNLSRSMSKDLSRSLSNVSQRMLGSSATAAESPQVQRDRSIEQLREYRMEEFVDHQMRRIELLNHRIDQILQMENFERPPRHLRIRVEREHVVQQSLQCLISVPFVDLLARRIQIRFHEEEGADAGGLARDWFDSLGRSLVAAAETGDGHFVVMPDGSLAPRPHDDRLMELYAIGRLAGLALWFAIPLPIPLSRIACKFLLGQPVTPVDVEHLDPDFVQFHVRPLLHPGGVEEFEAALGEPLVFTSAPTELRRDSTELCEGGAEKRVTEENKNEYVKLLCQHHLCGEMQSQINVLLQGFWDIFPKEILIAAGVSHRELALLISGYSELDPEQWQAYSRVACADQVQGDIVVGWFWEVVAEMSNEDRAGLLHFATGSSRLPSGGFAGITPNFTVEVSSEDLGLLPHAHTCINSIVLPCYGSKAQLKEKMAIALANDVGFGFQ